LRGLFVTGTDTEVGKTIVAAAVCAALAARGERVAAFKPVVTGLDEEPGEWPRDHEMLAGAASAGQRPDDVAPFTFGPPVSPHYAAELAGASIEPRELVDAARAAGGDADALICEGVGGLLVPLTPGYLVRDMAVDLDLPVAIAARPGLGTINHTLMTIEAARAVGLDVAVVVITPWPPMPGGVERSNMATIESLGSVRVLGLAPATPDTLAQAGAALALDEMVGEGGPGTDPAPALH
jgi:dethiobiotin synthetase